MNLRRLLHGVPFLIADASGGVRSVPFHLIVPTLNRWDPGRTVRVAFNGGDQTLYAKIEAAADEWTKPGVANLHLQFKSATGQYNKWSSNDTQYKAEIRIAFASGKDNGGYWSHVGNDSIDSTLSGGGPGEASLNLDSFDKSLPSDWRGIVMHEFGHALGLSTSPSVTSKELALALFKVVPAVMQISTFQPSRLAEVTAAARNAAP